MTKYYQPDEHNKEDRLNDLFSKDKFMAQHDKYQLNKNNEINSDELNKTKQDILSQAEDILKRKIVDDKAILLYDGYTPENDIHGLPIRVWIGPFVDMPETDELPSDTRSNKRKGKNKVHKTLPPMRPLREIHIQYGTTTISILSCLFDDFLRALFVAHAEFEELKQDGLA
jgi:hypothetical protein